MVLHHEHIRHAHRCSMDVWDCAIPHPDAVLKTTECSVGAAATTEDISVRPMLPVHLCGQLIAYPATAAEVLHSPRGPNPDPGNGFNRP